MRPWEHLAASATGTKPAGSKRAQARFESSLLLSLLKKATYREAVLSQYRAGSLYLKCAVPADAALSVWVCHLVPEGRHSLQKT